jgi:hypothetical protein
MRRDLASNPRRVEPVRRGIQVALLLLAITALFGLGSQTASASQRLCKNTYGGDVILAKLVKCSNARAVVRAWAARYKQDGVTDRTVRGFNCIGTNDPVEGLVVTCHRFHKRITFFANVP